MSRNLEPGQYQLGDFIFGFGTLFNVDEFDVGGYDVNVQDYQSHLSDEARFGSDSLKPGAMQLVIHALKNRLLKNVAGLVNETRDLVFDHDRRVGEFAAEWRADEVRHRWGALKPLYVCREDGSVVMVFGRPGKLAVTKSTHQTIYQTITAEFRRSDTLCYSEIENYVRLQHGQILRLVRSGELGMGDAPCWLRFIIVGPMTHPIIQIGPQLVELDVTLDIGEKVEINSYPWSRRVISLDTGANLSRKLIQPYLDKMSFDANSIVEFSWDADDINVSRIEETFETPEDFALKWEAPKYIGPGLGTMSIGEYGFPIPPFSRYGLIWNDSGNQWRLGTTVLKEPTITPYQFVKTVIGVPAEHSLIEEDCTNRIIGQSNLDMTQYLYWDITYTHAWFGVHLDGIDYPITEKIWIWRILQIIKVLWADLFDGVFGIGDPQEDWEYGAEFGTAAGLRTSALYINGCRIASYDGGASTDWISDSFGGLHSGVGMRATQRFLGQSTPGPYAAFKVQDNVPPELESEYGNIGPSGVYLLWRNAWQTI